MALVGAVGYAILIDWPPALSLVAQIARDTAESYALSVVPLFILMGNFVSRAGLSEQLYTASNAFLGHRRGGLAMATIVACGGFSAVCGSSLATAATMAKVAMPSMRRFGYADSIATGSIAAGGTLGILIPPSVVLVIYGLITQSDVSKLFAAGILPGIVGILFYVGAVQFMIWLKPELGPPGERTAWPARWRALRDVWGVVLLFVVVIGGIYVGAFTPTEAAGIGAFGALLFTLFKRGARPAHAVPGAGGDRRHHLDAVRRADRRPDLRQLHQRNRHAEPAGRVRALAGGPAALRDLRHHGDLHPARLRVREPVDAAADRAGLRAIDSGARRRPGHDQARGADLVRHRRGGW